MVGDGMGLTQITAGMYANGNRTVFERFKVVGLQKTHAAENLITDSAAGATAFACGEKTYNGAISVDVNQQPLKTLFEDCDELGIRTGVAVTSTITHATPACFYAHNVSRRNYWEIALDLAASNMDLAIGYGLPEFNKRPDGQDLVRSMEESGWNVHTSMEMAHQAKDVDRLAVLLAGDEAPRLADRPENYLKDAAMMAIGHLQAEPYMLVVEGSQIDWGGHANESDYIITEMIEFDQTIQAVLDWAEEDGNTLVVVTADHETGGYAINGGNMDSLSTKFTTVNHTGTMVPVFAYGPGSEYFAGVYDNTEIHTRMKKAMGW